MKCLNLTLAALTLMIAGSAFASGDRMETEFVCNQPGIADAGYSVVIRSGGLWFHTDASISEDTFAGANEIQTFVVEHQIRMGGGAYLDRETQGKLFSLKMTLTAPHNGRIQMPAHLEADTKAGRISVDLLCFPVHALADLGLDHE